MGTAHCGHGRGDAERERHWRLVEAGEAVAGGVHEVVERVESDGRLPGLSERARGAGARTGARAAHSLQNRHFRNGLESR
jgi:hypothetical protein